MRAIIINKDVEEYEHDVWKGFSARQLIFGGASVAAASGLILFAWIVCYVPIRAAVYPGIPVGVIIALIGFMKVDDMTCVEYFREIWRLSFSEPLTWQSEEYDTAKEAYEEKLKNFLNRSEELGKELEENELHYDGTRRHRILFHLRRRHRNRGIDLSRIHGQKIRKKIRPVRHQGTGRPGACRKQKHKTGNPEGKSLERTGMTEINTVEEMTKETGLTEMAIEENAAGQADEKEEILISEKDLKRHRRGRRKEKNAGRCIRKSRRGGKRL